MGTSEERTSESLPKYQPHEMNFYFSGVPLKERTRRELLYLSPGDVIGKQQPLYQSKV